MVDEHCELAKQSMKEKPAAKLGSFQNAVTTADGAWLTRGRSSELSRASMYIGPE